MPGESRLRRLYGGFPVGGAALALLLLRSTAGGVLLWQASCYWRAGDTESLAMGAGSALAGVLLIAGLFTPVVAVGIVLRGVAIKAGWLPNSVPPVLQTAITTAFAFAIMASLALLGPGALSIDARLFGRRRIIIPPH